MAVVCIVECDDCGKIPIGNPAKVAFFMMDDDIIGVAKCPDCGQVIMKPISRENVEPILTKGVKLFSFSTGEETVL